MKTTIGGLPVTIASAAECEQAGAVVCGSTSHFPDDVHTTCSVCGTPVVHRPHAPAKPPRVCISCFIAMVGPKH